MVRPKQIIYPMRYFSLLSEMVTEDAFVERLTPLLGKNAFVKTIGRARAGLYLLTKLAVREGRRSVVLSPYTIPDVINMVRFAGGVPVFVDTLPHSTNIDLDDLVECIDETTCCVIVTHYHFNQNSMNTIRSLCSLKGIMLIDDCALSFGSAPTDGGHDGAADASIFSFSGFKTLNFFWGGAISTHSPEIARCVSYEVNKWQRLRWFQYNDQALRILKYDLCTRSFLFSLLTFPLLKWRARRRQGDVAPFVRVESKALDDTILSRPSIGAICEWNRKLGMIDTFIGHRRSIASIYIEELQDQLVAGETPTEIREGSALVNCPIHVDPDRRAEIYGKILANGFDVGLSLYPNVHEIPGFEQVRGRSKNVAKLVRSVITLPTHPNISKEYAYRLAHVIRDAVKTV